MTTSCCPAYTGWVDKHAPMLKPFVSETRSPMVYAARYAKEKYPDAEVVFIGPCLAKRHEADVVPEVDYVMSFEELGAFMVAYDIHVSDCSEKELDQQITRFGRGLPRPAESVMLLSTPSEINTRRPLLKDWIKRTRLY